MTEAFLAPATCSALPALTLGAPQFRDTRLATLASTQGPAAA